MYLIRRAKPDDVEMLLKLSKTVHFINLPSDKDLISEKVRRSRLSFKAAATGEAMDLQSMDGSAAGRSRTPPRAAIGRPRSPWANRRHISGRARSGCRSSM